jgi:predicted ester cyclase
VSTLQETNKAAIRRFNRDFVETGDRAIFDELVSTDFNNHGAPGGREAAFQFFSAFRAAFPDVKVIIHDQFADGDVVITRKSYRGTQAGPWMDIPPTNKVVEIVVIDIVRLRDGKQTEHWASADMLGLLQQLKSP